MKRITRRADKKLGIRTFVIITTSSQEIAGKEKVQNPGHNIRLDPLQLTDCKGTQSHPFSPMQTFGPLPFSMTLHIAKSRPITSTAGFCVTLFWEGVKIRFLGLRKGSRYLME